MDDRELLTLAAKAYWGEEIDDVCSIRWGGDDNAILYTHADNQDHNGRDVEYWWNPLTDDGDALRLAVKLNFTVQIGQYVSWADSTDPYAEDHGTDPYAATRRVIVRAAAELGRAS